MVAGTVVRDATVQDSFYEFDGRGGIGNGHDRYESRAALVCRNATQRGQQFSTIVRVGGTFAGETGGKRARTAAQGVNFQPGIIGKRQLSRKLRNHAGFFTRVGVAGVTVFNHGRCRGNVVQQTNRHVEIVQQGRDFPLFIPIARREDQFHVVPVDVTL